jgi:hypothetical protein
MKKLITLFLIPFLGITYSQATTWETISFGFWQDSTVWLGGAVPDTTSGDTFIIKHAIVIDSDLTFESGAYMLIEKEGGICGHQIGTLLQNSTVVIYGILELDELYINSGFLRIYQGELILYTYAELKGQGAVLKVEEDARMVVGEWFDCVSPTFDFALDRTASTSVEVKSSVSVYPNPFTNTITIKISNDNLTTVKVCDLSGKEVLKSYFTTHRINTLDLDFLKSGIYILTVANKDEAYVTKIIKN